MLIKYKHILFFIIQTNYKCFIECSIAGSRNKVYGCVKHMCSSPQLITNTNDSFLHMTLRSSYGEPEDEKKINYEVRSIFSKY